MGHLNSQSPLKKITAFISFDEQVMYAFVKDVVEREMAKILAEQAKKKPDDRIFTVAEAAREATVSESTIRRCIRSGDLKSYRIGKKGKLVRIYESDLKSLFGDRDIRGMNF